MGSFFLFPFFFFFFLSLSFFFFFYISFIMVSVEEEKSIQNLIHELKSDSLKTILLTWKNESEHIRENFISFWFKNNTTIMNLFTNEKHNDELKALILASVEPLKEDIFSSLFSIALDDLQSNMYLLFSNESEVKK